MHGFEASTIVGISCNVIFVCHAVMIITRTLSIHELVCQFIYCACLHLMGMIIAFCCLLHVENRIRATNQRVVGSMLKEI